MLVAAEPSGDALGAGLAAALRARLGPDVRFIGVGGPMMAAEGVRSAFDPSDLAVLGIFDALRVWPRVRRRARETGELAARERPDVAVLIDSWGFNLRVARQIRRRDPAISLVKYVAPQVWATRPGRARTLARTVNRLLTIHAFDAPLFERVGLSTTFVGNPTLSRDISGARPERLRQRLAAGPNDPILLLAPGSRRGEVDRLMGPLGDAAERLLRRYPDLKVVVLTAEGVAGAVAQRAALWRFPAHLARGSEESLDAMAAATVAIACSGTVTTELARLGAPMVVTYRVGPFTAPLVRLLIRTPWITLFNVAARRFVAPELVQEACNGAALAAAAERLLDAPQARAAQSLAQSEALKLMAGGVEDPSGAAAEAIAALLDDQARSSRDV
jgi:lipid-A-disaccharide synthase